MSLLVVGTLAVDTLETPFARRERVLGGSATYIALSANYFTHGAQISVVSVVGEDFPQEGWELLRDNKIDTSGVEVVKGGKTFFWEGKYHYDMNTRDTITTELNVLADFDPKVPEAHRNAPFVVLGNIAPHLQEQVLNQLTATPKLVACDTMNFWITGSRKDLERTLERVNMLVVNDSEARLLIEHPSLVVAGRRLQGMLSAESHRIVVIKKGEHGALVFYDDHIFSAPSYPLEEIFDPTGAGDSFMGGMVGYLASRDTLEYADVKRAVIYGTVLASFCCSKFSTEGLENIDMTEIYLRFREIQSLSAFEDEPNPPKRMRRSDTDLM
jgi:sugar/nucleoside kinase (ribokinase family)